MTACASGPSAQPPVITIRRCGPATLAIRSRISSEARPVDSSAARQTSAGVTALPIPVSATRSSLRPCSSIPPAAAGASIAARSSSGRSSGPTPSRSSTRSSAAPERIAPSRHWRPSTACQPTLTCVATAARAAAGSSGATARMNAWAVPHETSTSPSRGGARPDGGAQVVVTADRQHGAAGARQRFAGGAGRGRRRSRIGEQPGRRARPGERVVPPVACMEVEPAGARGERELGDLVAAEPVHDPLADAEPADAALRGLMLLAQPAVLGERAQRSRREPGAFREARRAELGRHPLGLLGAARVVPCDRRRHRSAARVEQHAGLGDAGHADRADRPVGRRGQRLARRCDGRADQQLRVDLRAGLDALPRHPGPPVGHLLAAVGDHGGLARGGSQVEPEQQRLHAVCLAAGHSDRRRAALESRRRRLRGCTSPKLLMSPRASSNKVPFASLTSLPPRPRDRAAGSGSPRAARPARSRRPRTGRAPSCRRARPARRRAR